MFGLNVCLLAFAGLRVVLPLLLPSVVAVFVPSEVVLADVEVAVLLEVVEVALVVVLLSRDGAHSVVVLL